MSDERERGGRKYEHTYPPWATGFVQLPNEILLDAGLSAGAVRAYALLFNLASRNEGVAEPEMGAAAATIGVTEKTLRGHIRELEKAGLVTSKRRGLGLTNRYIVHPPDTPKKGSTGSVKKTDQERSKTTDPTRARPTGEKLDRSSEANASSDAVARKRDLPFDAMAEATSADPDLEGGRIAKAVNALRKHPDYVALVEEVGKEAAETRLAVEIKARGERYRIRFPGITISPQALVNNWRRVVDDDQFRPTDVDRFFDRMGGEG